MQAGSNYGLFRRLNPWTKRDAEEAAKRREEGISQVVTNSGDWAERCRAEAEKALSRLSYGALFIGEDLRLAVLEQGLEAPAHPNAWGGVIGGVIRNALRSGNIEVSGMLRASTVQSHRRVCAQYRKLY